MEPIHLPTGQANYLAEIPDPSASIGHNSDSEFESAAPLKKMCLSLLKMKQKKVQAMQPLKECNHFTVKRRFKKVAEGVVPAIDNTLYYLCSSQH